MNKIISRAKTFLYIVISAVLISVLFGCTFLDDKTVQDEKSISEGTDSYYNEETQNNETEEDISDNKLEVEAKTEVETEIKIEEKTSTEQSEKESTKNSEEESASKSTEESEDKDGRYSDIPIYSGDSYVELNDNSPDFTDEEKKSTEAFEYYSELDRLGRCGVAFANICKELMPTEERGEIGSIKPTGWHTIKYPDLIEDNYLFNRSHLIAYSLAGENANEKNLITGTRYLNQETMQIFELRVLDYVRNTDNHVLYRVTPVFEGENLLATGVQMEGWSVEDEGRSICFNVFCYNIQPGIKIDYATGDSEESGESENAVNVEKKEAGENVGDSKKAEAGENVGDSEKEDTKENAEDVSDTATDSSSDFENKEMTFIVNTNTGRIHLPECRSVNEMAEHNKMEYEGTLNELKDKGYTPCGRCLAMYK